MSNVFNLMISIPLMATIVWGPKASWS